MHSYKSDENFFANWFSYWWILQFHASVKSTSLGLLIFLGYVNYFTTPLEIIYFTMICILDNETKSQNLILGILKYISLSPVFFWVGS